MLVAGRQRRIERLHGTGVVSTEDLSQSLSVSHETIRRDLALLEKRGLLSRVNGGATAPLPVPPGEEPPSLNARTLPGRPRNASGGRQLHS